MLMLSLIRKSDYLIIVIFVSELQYNKKAKFRPHLFNLGKGKSIRNCFSEIGDGNGKFVV